MPNSNFFDVMLDELSTGKEKVQLDEGFVPFSPFIAYAAFKKKVFNSFKNNKLFQLFRAGKQKAAEVKGKAEVATEKLRAAVGKSSKGTVYKFTPEQISVMADIYNKYGKQLVAQILDFRKNVLAPYQVIKRIIKSSSRVSSKDITGLSKEEYKASLESGRKKIEGRGGSYFERVEELRNKLDQINEQRKNLEKLKDEFEGEVPRIDYNIVSKVFKHFNIGEAPEGYTKEELKKNYDEIMKNYKIMLTTAEQEDISPEEFKKMRDIRKRQRELWAGKNVDLTKQNKNLFFRKGSFNVALGKYFFGREVIRQLTQPRQVFNVFKKTYISIIDGMMQKLTEQKQTILDELIGMKKGSKFSDKEGKVWGKLPHIKSFSGKPEDYYQKVREEDFLHQPIQIPRSPALIDAERKIENEIKKFEHHLKSIISEEDFGKLRRYRLIGNLITIKELRSPESLFKSKAELMAQGGEESEEKKGYLDPEEFNRKIKELAGKTYHSLSELNDAKKEANLLVKKMGEQGDETSAVTDELRKLRERTSPELEGGEEKEEAGSAELKEIEDFAKGMLNREYTAIDSLKRDELHLQNLIKTFEDSHKDARDQLGIIRHLLDKVDTKITKDAGTLK